MDAASTEGNQWRRHDRRFRVVQRTENSIRTRARACGAIAERDRGVRGDDAVVDSRKASSGAIVGGMADLCAGWWAMPTLLKQTFGRLTFTAWIPPQS